MRRAHPSRALRSLAFNVLMSAPDAPARVTRARTLATLPGRFRTTTLPATRKTATVRNNQRMAIFERGRLVVSRTRMDLTTLLAYDVFAQGIDSTIKALEAAGVRYGVARRDRLDGRRVWVVGAAENDGTSPQFWVDAEEWQVVRVIQRDFRASRVILDVRFSDFTDVMGVPIATRVDVYRNGELSERQTITDVAVNPVVPTRAFDVARWRDVSVGN
jgi:outer membrane lipoprotein-sorting protein